MFIVHAHPSDCRYHNREAEVTEQLLQPTHIKTIRLLHARTSLARGIVVHILQY
jgi:hypothetical protein